MTFPRANPLGWALYEVLTSAQMNAIDLNLSRALDGYGGGSYNPSSLLRVGGKIIGENVLTRVVVFPIEMCVPNSSTGWDWTTFGNHWISPAVNDSDYSLSIPINRILPKDTLIERVRWLVKQSVAAAAKGARITTEALAQPTALTTPTATWDSYYPINGTAVDWIESQGGVHDGGDNQSILTDSWATWTPSQFVGDILYNLTDGSSGTITANTATTITAALSGGTDNDWDNGDRFRIGLPLPLSSGIPTDTYRASYRMRKSSTAGQDILYNVEVTYHETNYQNVL